MTYIFFVPVHEAPECVSDLIDSISSYYPDALVILHKPRNNDPRFNFERKNVYVVNFCYSGYLDGSLAYIYHKLFKYLKKNKISFDKLILCASNEVFISNLHYKIGGHPHVNGTERTKGSVWYNIASKYFSNCELYSINPEGFFLYESDLDEIVISTEKHFGVLCKIIFETSVGLFLRKKMSPMLRKGYKYIPKHLLKFTFPLEEFLYQNGAVNVDVNATPLCYCNWANELRLTVDEIKAIDRNRYASVKRVPRVINDEIRAHLRNERSNFNINASL